MGKNTRKNRGNKSAGESGAMTVSEIAQRVELPVSVVRYYTRINLLKPRRNRGNDYKLYAHADISKILFIRKAQALGYTLSEIVKIFEEASRGDSPCPMVREIIVKRIKENRNRVDALLAMQLRMEKAVAKWRKMPNGIPSGRSVCHLIEASA